MVRRLVAVLFVLLMGGMALANGDPAELPPPDFVSLQYIDSKGCVFRRENGGRWAPRLDSDDQPVCGYPPTLSARRLSPDGGAALFAPNKPEPSRAHQIEQALAGVVIPNLQAGELVADREPFQKRPDMGPEPSSSQPLRELRAEIENQGRVRAQMNGVLQPNRSLCHLLGLNTPQAGGAGVIPGADPTQGFCDSSTRGNLARLAFTRPANLPVPPEQQAVAKAAIQPGVRVAANHGALPARRKPAATSSVPAHPAQADAGKAGAPRKPTENAPSSVPPSARAAPPTGETAPRAAPKQPEGPWISGIPAGSRFILIGTYPNGPEVANVLRRLTRMGMPIARQISPAPVQGSTQVILVGPFDDRQAIVRAFDRLRKAGLPAAPR